MGKRYFLLFFFLIILFLWIDPGNHLAIAKDAGQTLDDESRDGDYLIYFPLFINPGSKTELKNGGFESGNDGSWSLYSLQGLVEDIIYKPEKSDFVQPYEGQFIAWLGGYQNEVTRVSQYIYINQEKPIMNFWYWVESIDACGNDFFRVKINNTTIHQLDLCTSTNSTDWEHQVLDLTAYANKTVVLLFEVTTNDTSVGDPYGSGLYLDAISFQ